jgi:hypothetical protein
MELDMTTVLFSEMTPAPEWEGEFNDWYNTEHIPLRMRAPGFTSAQRYRANEGPAYLAVYEMETAGALKTPEYQLIKGQPSELTKRMLSDVSGFTRYICNESGRWEKSGSASINAAVLYAVFFEVPADRADDFDRWYTEDHIPLLMKCDDWLMVRRFDIIDGEPGKYTHLALHYLASTDALSSPEREAARATPWRAKLAAESWFKGHYVVFNRIGTRFQAAA